MKRKLRATGWFKPYTDKKYQRRYGDVIKTISPARLVFSGAGCYLIKRKIEGKWKIVYVGMSNGDVKKTLYRHFQVWNDKRLPWNPSRGWLDRVTYFDVFNNEEFLVKVIITASSEEARVLEEVLIKKLKPTDNKAKLSCYIDQYPETEARYNDSEKVVPDMDWQLADLPF